MSEFERKPDGGLSAWIETYEAMGGGENDAEMLCLLLELRRRRENQAEAERERDELRADVELGMQLIKRMERQVLDYQREIARRDAAAGEPVAWQYRYNDGKVGDWHTVDSESECNHLPCYERRPIYTTAQPAVLPPEMINADAPCHYSSEETFAWVAGANWMREQCLALGAQQQKVVELHKRKSTEVISGQRYSYVLLEDLLPELDAANVKWEVKK